MPVTSRDFEVLKLLARYFVMSRSQINRLCYPSDESGRITRRRLGSLCREGFIRNHTMEVVNPVRGGSIPVYHLDQRGREHLAIELKDDTYYLKPTKVSHALHLYHALLVTEIYITIDAAITAQSRATLQASFNEHEVVNVDEADPKKHYRLFIEISHEHPRIACSPDLGILLGVENHRAAFYMEVETGKNGPRWSATRKHRGYFEHARRGLHRRHFPTATLDTPHVLSIWPTPNQRDAFLRQLRGKDGATLWRAASSTELTADTFLFGKIWYRTDGDEPGALVKS